MNSTLHNLKLRGSILRLKADQLAFLLNKQTAHEGLTQTLIASLRQLKRKGLNRKSKLAQGDEFQLGNWSCAMECVS